ncbi:hypothetical protein [Paenibacillus sp. 1001270B_150601_E10]|uniref:hypothetical protein n=1 Tax=Paenibacillus sp. 1001270B_150601_E10 TaxID=2787079 RepID=UPI00189DFBCB|nr:hypothetical protein [Paenibacillus sp. 1001270B_150601_E10]
MTRTIVDDIELFAAALSQSYVEAWQEDSAGVYCMVDAGVIVKYTPEFVKIKNTIKSTNYYRDMTLFQVITGPSDE